MKLTLPECDAMVALADEGGKGNVSYAEFIDMMDAFWGHPKPPRWQLWWTAWLEAAKRNEDEKKAAVNPKLAGRRGSFGSRPDGGRRGSVSLTPLEGGARPTRWGAGANRNKLDPGVIAEWKTVFEKMCTNADGTLALRDVTKCTKLPKPLACKLYKHLDATDDGSVSFPTFIDVVGPVGAPLANGWWKPVLESFGEKSPAMPKRRSIKKARGAKGASDSEHSLPTSPEDSPALVRRTLKKVEGRTPAALPTDHKEGAAKLKTSLRRASTREIAARALSESPDAKARNLPSLGADAKCPSAPVEPTNGKRNLPSLRGRPKDQQ